MTMNSNSNARLKRSVPLWVFLPTLALAILGFVLLGRANLKHYDEVYGIHAQEYFSKMRVLGLLNQHKFDEAKTLLEGETNELGIAVALCLMNDCSKEAIKVKNAFEHKQ